MEENTGPGWPVRQSLLIRRPLSRKPERANIKALLDKLAILTGELDEANRRGGEMKIADRGVTMASQIEALPQLQ